MADARKQERLVSDRDHGSVPEEDGLKCEPRDRVHGRMRHVKKLHIHPHTLYRASYLRVLLKENLYEKICAVMPSGAKGWLWGNQVIKALDVVFSETDPKASGKSVVYHTNGKLAKDRKEEQERGEVQNRRARWAKRLTESKRSPA